MGSDDGKPQFTCRLITRPYRISRYPVTVAQYDAFVAAGGYGMAAYWKEAAEQGVWQDGQLRCFTWSTEKQEYEEESATGPADDGPAFSGSNQPRVGASWYEALAFCRWLAERLGQEVRLPTEAEWSAPRGTLTGVPTHGVTTSSFAAATWPIREFGVTCAVGIFPDGDAECGGADMAGNVWDWCSTKWRGDYKDYERSVDDDLAGADPRVVRGGSFDYIGYLVRCACRGGFDPGGRYYDVGFRVFVPRLLTLWTLAVLWTLVALDALFLWPGGLGERSVPQRELTFANIWQMTRWQGGLNLQAAPPAPQCWGNCYRFSRDPGERPPLPPGLGGRGAGTNRDRLRCSAHTTRRHHSDVPARCG